MIEYEISGGVAIIRFTVGRLNIMTPAFHERLCRLMLRFMRDDALKVAVLTSAVGQSFSAAFLLNGPQGGAVEFLYNYNAKSKKGGQEAKEFHTRETRTA